MSTKPQFLETDLLFEAFDNACKGLPFNISKPEEKWIGKTLSFKDYENESKNIANCIIRQFLKEQSDTKVFRDNNHIALKKIGRSFQIINLFPEIELNPPNVFVWEDDENYYLYKTKKVVARINTNYLVRYQHDAGDLNSQYFYDLPVAFIVFEVDEPKCFNRKDFVSNWISFHSQYNKSINPLQRSFEEKILLGKGKSYPNFDPSKIWDMIYQAVDFIWSKEEHTTKFKSNIDNDLSPESYKLISKFIKNCQINKAILNQISKDNDFKSEILNLNIMSKLKP